MKRFLTLIVAATAVAATIKVKKRFMSYLHYYQTRASKRCASGQIRPRRERSPFSEATGPCPHISASRPGRARCLRSAPCKLPASPRRTAREANARLSARHSGAHEIDVAALDIGAGELYAQRITHVQPLKPPDQASFRNRLQDAHPHALVRSAGHQGIELLADTRFEQHGGGALAHLALDPRGIAFLLGAVCRELAQLLVAVGRGAPGERGLQQPLGDDVREAAVRRRGVRVVIHRQSEVSFGSLSGALEHILAGPQQLDDRERQVRKLRRGRLLAPDEKSAERPRVRRCGQTLAQSPRQLDDPP